MTLKQTLQPYLAAAITSPRSRELLRTVHEAKRRIGGQPHRLTVWLKLDDPYSYLLLQELPRLLQHFTLTVELRFLGELDPAMFPACAQLAAYALADASRLAQYHGLNFPAELQAPQPSELMLGNRILLACEREPLERLLPLAKQVFAAAWERHPNKLATLAERFPLLPLEEAEFLLLAAREDLEQAGHYLPATLQYAGEWYWGLDRLPHLARRLQKLGAARHSHDYVLGTASPELDSEFLIHDWEHLTAARAQRLPLDFYFSFRSPYSYLALQRLFALADHYQLRLNIKPVLPMVMRGLPLPRAKRFYILQDAKREAEQLGLPFGRICDPVGAGVEHCMALFGLAQAQNKEREYLLSMASGIWAEGRNVADDAQLAPLLERAGLAWSDAQPLLYDNGWREAAEAHRQELEDLGLWGVPALHLHLPQAPITLWGQDRFWALEAAIADSLAASATAASPNIAT